MSKKVWKCDVIVPERSKGFGAEKIVIAPKTRATIELEIDLAALFDYMGRKACKSTAGRSTAMSRMVKAKVLRKVAA